MKLTIRPIEPGEAPAERDATSRRPTGHAERELLGGSYTPRPKDEWVPLRILGPNASEMNSGTAAMPSVNLDIDEGIPEDEISPDSSEGESLVDEDAIVMESSEDEADPTEPIWRRSRWPAAIFITALLAFGALWYFASRTDRGLMLSRVQIKGASLLSNREVLALANINYAVPFYSIDLKAIEARLLRHSLIRSAQVVREVDPPTLILTIQERQPIALLRSDSTGEAFIVDREGLLLRPKLIAGLRNPAQFLQEPLLTGVSEHDTAGYQAMAKLVVMIGTLDSSALERSIGELHRTPSGDYVIYTSETQTPLFIGSPFAHAFHTSLEAQTGILPTYSEPLFNRQLELLARAWKNGLRQRVLTGNVLYVDARFNGQLILKQASIRGMNASAPSNATILQSTTNNAHYATNTITNHQGPRSIH